jgi:hypothetical protein
MPDDLSEVRHAVDRLVVRLDGKILHPLRIEDQGPSEDVGPERRQEPVIEAGSPTEPMSSTIESQSRDQDPVNLGRLDLPAIGARLGDAKNAGDEVMVDVGHLVESKATGRPIHRREDELFAAGDDPSKHRLRVDLLGERRGVEQDGSGPLEAGESPQAHQEGGFLGSTSFRVHRPDPRDDLSPDRGLAGLDVQSGISRVGSERGTARDHLRGIEGGRGPS